MKRDFGLTAAVLVLVTLGLSVANGGETLRAAVKSLFVVVENTPANPVPTRDVESSARQAVQGVFSLQIPPGQVSAFETVFTVPAGKRLTIEHVSFRGPRVLFQICSTLNGVGACHQVPVLTTGVPGGFMGSQPLRLYADPGTDLTAEVVISNIDISEYVLGTTGSWSGYLVECGATPGCPAP